MTELAIQWLTIVDLERLEALESCQSRPWSRRQLESALNDADGCVLGAVLADRLVGHVVVVRLPFEAELQAMLVEPAMRRRGLAAALLEATIRQCRRWGSERLLLEVRAGNVPAIALYRRTGFSEDGWRRGYYPPLEDMADANREDALLMSRRL
ncbi:ribosomal protein S18-alanine N-acetyltransferase [Halomonas sp. MCCC 1A11036]|uniref:[Ribosomal protein bS18]-alanine N-acetyltransferase n=1 Tax=Billgrantia zhangzhouensis TaxID=2733481 RepID=A0ABS9AG94_9GAMM|nr:ribosomal protein S18-alanine N-acetyltransferase [Halomonas zhangzhouensis]MCE8020731.1 ribosomal protein S18-alanine N-acetyltransferase [Halomonas zhangzhouensis]